MVCLSSLEIYEKAKDILSCNPNYEVILNQGDITCDCNVEGLSVLSDKLKDRVLDHELMKINSQLKDYGLFARMTTVIENSFTVKIEELN